jgi:PAS domain S-box-containing protein
MLAPAQGLAATNYPIRAAAFLYCFAVVGVLLWERGAGLVAWTLLLLQFIAYPHAVYWRTRLAARPTRAELHNLFLDSVLLGAWSAALGFPTWIAYAFITATGLNTMVNRGPQGLAWSIAFSAGGAVLWVLVRGLEYQPATSELVTFLSAAGVLAYTGAVAYVVHNQNRRLAAARDALRRSEDRYRLIAENAGDLIAMIDHEGCWLYTSPSYERVMTAADLAPGADAFRNVHPADAEAVRKAVMSSSLSSKPREIGMRLVDKEGRVRQYRTWVHGIPGEDKPPRLLLVSQDVTDLRESEERQLLAAQALEEVTEAIVITSAAGIIVTVNRAFSELTGFVRDEVLGQPEKAIRNALQPDAFYDEIFAAAVRDGHWSGMTWARRTNGSVYREWRSVHAVRDSYGVVTHYVMVFAEAGARSLGVENSRNS